MVLILLACVSWWTCPLHAGSRTKHVSWWTGPSFDMCSSPLFCPQMMPVVCAQMHFLNWCSGLSRRRGGLACAVHIFVGRILGLLPGSPFPGGSESPRLLRRRALPLSTWSFELTRLLLSRARGPASPTPAFHGTTTTTRTTGVYIRNTGADPKDTGATAVAPMSGALAVTAGVAPSGVGATAAAA